MKKKYTFGERSGKAEEIQKTLQYDEGKDLKEPGTIGFSASSILSGAERGRFRTLYGHPDAFEAVSG